MKKISLIILVFFLTNCSLNNNSNKQLNKIMKKQNDIISMSFSEYKIFIEEYAKKSKYPEIK